MKNGLARVNCSGAENSLWTSTWTVLWAVKIIQKNECDNAEQAANNIVGLFKFINFEDHFSDCLRIRRIQFRWFEARQLIFSGWNN